MRPLQYRRKLIMLMPVGPVQESHMRVTPYTSHYNFHLSNRFLNSISFSSRYFPSISRPVGEAMPSPVHKCMQKYLNIMKSTFINMMQNNIYSPHFCVSLTAAMKKGSSALLPAIPDV